MSSRKSRLAPSKHHLQVSNDPPSELKPTQHITRISKLHGNSLYTVELPSKSELLVELPMKFRNAVWVRRGGFVLIDTEGHTNGKVNGEIMDVVRDEKVWRRLDYWYVNLHFCIDFRPTGFRRKEESDDEPEKKNKEQNVEGEADHILFD
jgi:translation initiation factor IF-1